LLFAELTRSRVNAAKEPLLEYCSFH